MTQIIQFSTPSCGQCPQQAEIPEDLVEDPSSVDFEKIDATEEVKEANKYGVRAVLSTIVLDEDGTVVSKFDGVTQADAIESLL